MKYHYFSCDTSGKKSFENGIRSLDIALQNRLQVYKSKEASQASFFKSPPFDSKPIVKNEWEAFPSLWTGPYSMPTNGYQSSSNFFSKPDNKNKKAYPVFLNGSQANRTQQNKHQLRPTPYYRNKSETFNSCFIPPYNSKVGAALPPTRWVEATPEKRSVHSQTDICDVRSILRNCTNENASSNVTPHHEVACQTDYNPDDSCNNATESKSKVSMRHGLFSSKQLSNDNVRFNENSSKTTRSTVTNSKQLQHTDQKNSTASTETKIRIYRTQFVNCLDSTCKQTFPCENELKEHLLKVHDIRHFSCPLVLECGISFENNEQLEVHMKEAHGDLKVWDCYSCMRLFDNRPSFELHLDAEHHQGRFECNFANCNFASFTRKVMMMHYWRVHCGEAFFIDT